MLLSIRQICRSVQRASAAGIGSIVLFACTPLKEDVPVVDAGDDAGEDAGDSAPAVDMSCKQIHADRPDAPSGVYALVDGRAFTAYCEMELDGGGWTAIFSGLNGNVNASFASFKRDTDVCPNPKTKCLHRAPESVTAKTEFMATCATNAVVFKLSAEGVRYLTLGVDDGWVPTSDARTINGSFDAGIASQLWTGDGLDNLGFIVSANDNNGQPTPSTFSASYAHNALWNFCAGVSDASSAVHLFYR